MTQVHLQAENAAFGTSKARHSIQIIGHASTGVSFCGGSNAVHPCPFKDPFAFQRHLPITSIEEIRWLASHAGILEKAGQMGAPGPLHVAYGVIHCVLRHCGRSRRRGVGIREQEANIALGAVGPYRMQCR